MIVGNGKDIYENPGTFWSETTFVTHIYDLGTFCVTSIQTTSIKQITQI